ncbi:MAG: hypothetical protein EA402_09650 [Planctomycetota bacterium]|nr:MAG: hypothetical protein EA402_09650 [Planctomycetota bacterium]
MDTSVPHETPLALDLFPDEHETQSFQGLGFHCGTDFLLLAQRLGVVSTRAQRLLARFLDREALRQVDELIGRFDHWKHRSAIALWS